MIRTTLLSLSVLAALATAQSPPSSAQITPEALRETGTEPVAGKIPGTRRFNVTFAQRSFTLDAFREAIATLKTHEDVSEIVRSMQSKAHVDYSMFRSEVESLGGAVVIEFWLINACTIEVDPAKVGLLQRMPNVLHVLPDLPTYPVGTIPILVATNASHHNADAVQAAGFKGTGYSFAVIDTGQDSNMAGTGKPHRMYYRGSNNLDTTGGGLGGSLLLANKQAGAVPPDDPNDHGTGVASIVGGTSWNNAGADRGHAYDAGKVGYSICNSAPGCGSSLATEAAGWQAAAADRALYNIVAGNMSYTSTPSYIDVSQQAIDSCALNADLLPVTAAANSGASTSSSSSTANGLAVAAITPTTKAVAAFSSRGPLSGDITRFFPDIGGCGVNTVMAKRDNESANYTGSGTSMASPQVCGAATLIKSVRPTSSARELKAMLLCNTESIAAQNPVAPYNTRNAYGMGFLRDDLTSTSGQKPGTVLTRTISSTATPNLHPLFVTLGQPVSVVVTWYRTNLAATTFSNLNLRVLNGVTVVASSLDPRNLYEKVTFTAPITGAVIVEVAAVSIDGVSQIYSLASTHVFAAGVPASYSHYGNACPGSAGTPGISVSAAPTLGNPFTCKLSFAKPSSNAFLMFGVSNTIWQTLVLPFNLGALAPGCFILASGEVITAVPTTPSGQASVTFNVPSNVSLLGGLFYNQFVVQDAGVNPIGFVLSQAGKGTIGDF